jgi:hypothetical protein
VHARDIICFALDREVEDAVLVDCVANQLDVVPIEAVFAESFGTPSTSTSLLGRLWHGRSEKGYVPEDDTTGLSSTLVALTAIMLAAGPVAECLRLLSLLFAQTLPVVDSRAVTAIHSCTIVQVADLAVLCSPSVVVQVVTVT